MKLLITGATGLVGRHVAKAALDEGHQVTVLVRDAARLRPDIKNRAAVLQGPLDQRGVVPPGTEAVLNCAGVLSASSKAGFWDGNVFGPRSLYRDSRRAGVSAFVHLSSMGVYGLATAPHIREDTPFETHPQWRGGYTASKLDGDRLLLAESEEGGPALSLLRPPVVYGEGVPLPLGRLGRPIPGGMALVAGRGGTSMPLIYAGNLAAAVLAAAQRRSKGVFNLVDDASQTQRQYLKMLRKVQAGTPRPLFMPMVALLLPAALLDRGLGLARRSSHIAYRLRRNLSSLKVDDSRARSELDYRPRHALEEALRLTCAGETRGAS